MNRTERQPLQLNRIQMTALVVGLIGLAVTIAGAFISQDQFFRAYLLGYVFWIQIALGSFALVMLHHLVGGRWGFVARRIAETGAMTLPLMALLFVPLLFGLRDLYLWAQPEAVAESTLLMHKTPYLNVPFFLGRTVFYFVVWIGLAYLLNRWSLQQDKTGDPKLSTRMKNLSGLGMVLYVVTATFAAYDWMMSLEPKWFSSIYGVIYIAGQALITFTFVIILTRILSKQEPLAGWLSTNIYNDYGNFMLAFVSFWAYVSFSQYLIIWSANLPETITWYITRTHNGWQWVAMILIFFHFAVPFAILLSRRAKRNIKLLIGLAIFLFLMRFIDLFWQIMPAFNQTLTIHWLDLAAPIGIGGVWIAFFMWQLKGKSLLPLHDPRFQEVPAHE